MIKIEVEFDHKFVVEIPVNSFEEFEDDNMTIEDSDEMIAIAIEEQYGISDISNIWVGSEVKEDTK